MFQKLKGAVNKMKRFWVTVLQLIVFLICCSSFERWVLSQESIMFYSVLPLAYLPVTYIAQFLICKSTNSKLYMVSFVIMTVFIGIDVMIHVLANLIILSHGESVALCVSKIWFYGSLAILIPLLFRLTRLYEN